MSKTTKSQKFGAFCKIVVNKSKVLAGQAATAAVIGSQIAKEKAIEATQLAKQAKADFVKGYNSVN